MRDSHCLKDSPGPKRLEDGDVRDAFNSGYQNHLRHTTWVSQIVAIREDASDFLEDLRRHSSSTMLSSLPSSKSFEP